MRKNDLIEKLNNIPGNPEIVLWNGFVEDYQPIDSSVREVELVKHSKEFIAVCLQRQGIKQDQERIDSMFNAQEWTFPNEFTNEDERKVWYGNNRKKVLMLCGKARGLKQFDRSGDVHY